MEKNNNKPKLRFPGFTDPWEQRKLGEICEEFQSGKNIKAEDIKENGAYPVYGANGFRGYSDTYNHDGIYALIGRQGALCGNMNISSGKAYFTEHAIAVMANKSSETMFLFYLLGKMNLGQYSGQSAQPGLAVNKLLELSSSVPNYDEQKQISEFFVLLDHLITLHQRKLNRLQDKKKSLLQKMFPKNGEDFPELRFPKFTDPWEQSKLKQLANFAKGQGYSKNDLTVVGTPIILYGRLYTKYQSTISEVDTFALPQNGSVYSTGEEVIVPASGETAEDIARASAIVKPGFLLGGDLNVIYPNKEISTVFLALSISNGNQQKELSKKAQGKSVVHLHNSDLEDVTISYPCREEQEKIESVFANLDNIITLHQRKLNHLQEQKKALLQQMFV